MTPCHIGGMTMSSPQARPYTRPLGNGTGVQTGRAPQIDGFTWPAALSAEDTTLAAPGARALRRLGGPLAAHAQHAGAFQLRLPGTRAIRLSRMTTAP